MSGGKGGGGEARGGVLKRFGGEGVGQVPTGRCVFGSRKTGAASLQTAGEKNVRENGGLETFSLVLVM